MVEGECPGIQLNCKMYVHSIVSFWVQVILDLLELKLNGNGNQGGVSSDDNSTSPFNTHPVVILLGVLWLLLYSWVALATSTTATATSSSSPTSDSPPNRGVVASDLSAATISPSSSSLPPAATSAKIAGAETPRSSASAAASCSSLPAPATSSNALSSSAKMAVAESTPLSSDSTTASCSSSPAPASSSNSLSSAVEATVLSGASNAATCSSPAATSNPSLFAHRDAEVAIAIPTSSPTVAVSATSSSWISIILGKISYPASKLIAEIKCRPERLMLMFASMAISTFGCLLFPTSVQYYVLYTSYALIIGFNAFFLCLLPR